MASIPRASRGIQPRLHTSTSQNIPLHLRCIPRNLQRFSTSAASSQASKQGVSPPSTATTTVPSPHEINAPISTLPADLNLPESPPPTATTQDKIKRLFALARTYLAFYKTGLKNVFHNYRASLPLRKQLQLPLYLPVSPPRKISAPNTNASQPGLTMGRGQFQLVRRSARDIRRMIPFTLILIVCGEFTPLVIPIFGSAITPATCRVPSQIAKEQDTASKRKYAALLAHAWTKSRSDLKLASAVQGPVSVGGKDEMGLLEEFANPLWAANADPAAVLRACAVFGLVKRHDRFAGQALVGLVYRTRLRRYAEYLAIDDGMIRAGGGVAALSPAEVRIALDERGAGDVAGVWNGERATMVERKWLEKWLDLREGEVQSRTGQKKIL